MLTDVSQRYIEEVGASANEYATMSNFFYVMVIDLCSPTLDGRILPTLDDVTLALVEVGSNLTDLERFLFKVTSRVSHN